MSQNGMGIYLLVILLASTVGSVFFAWAKDKLNTWGAKHGTKFFGGSDEPPEDKK